MLPEALVLGAVRVLVVSKDSPLYVLATGEDPTQAISPFLAISGRQKRRDSSQEKYHAAAGCVRTCAHLRKVSDEKFILLRSAES